MPVILRSRFLRPDFELRPYSVSDETEWREVRGRNARWLRPWDSTSPVEAPPVSFRQWVRMLEDEAGEGTDIVWGMRLNGRLVGEISLGAIEYGSLRTGIAGYWVDQAMAGRGLAPLALAMVCDWALLAPDGPHLHRIEVDMLPANHNSRRVAEKTGFTFEGVRRQYMHVAGKWEDHESWTLLDSDPPVRSGSVEWSLAHRLELSRQTQPVS